MKVTCSECGKVWHEVPSEYRARLKKAKHGKLYCGRDCYIKQQRRKASGKDKP